MAHVWQQVSDKPDESFSLKSQEITRLRQYTALCMEKNKHEEAKKALCLAISYNNDLIVRYKPGQKVTEELRRAGLKDMRALARVTEHIKKKGESNKAESDPTEHIDTWQFPTTKPNEDAKAGWEKFKECVIFTKPTKSTWDDIVGHKDAKQYIEMALTIPMLYKGKLKSNQQPKGILLYGPPGTGKSMIAKAIATKLNVCFIHISPGQLLGKYLGESEQNIRIFYAMVKFLAPCIVFMDEIDSIAGNRDGDSSAPESRRSISCQLLEVMEHKEGGVFTVAATNHPWQIDPAFMRRLGKRYFIGLPNQNERLQLITKYLKDTRHSLLEFDIKALAQKTNNVSSADIVSFLNEAILRAFHKGQRANYYMEGSEGYWFPTTGLNPQARRVTAAVLRSEGKDFVPANLSLMDLELVAKPQACNEVLLKKYTQFAKEGKLTQPAAYPAYPAYPPPNMQGQRR